MKIAGLRAQQTLLLTPPTIKMSNEAKFKADQLVRGSPTPENNPSLEKLLDDQLDDGSNGSDTNSQLLDDVNDAIRVQEEEEGVNVLEEKLPNKQEQQIEEIIILDDKVQKLRIRQEINEIMLKMHKAKASDASVHARLKRAEESEGEGSGIFGFCGGADRK